MIDHLDIMHQLLDRAFGSSYQGATGKDIAGITVGGEYGHRVQVAAYDPDSQIISVLIDGTMRKMKIKIEMDRNEANEVECVCK